MVVREGHAKTAVAAFNVVQRVNEPALDHRAGAKIFTARACPEERVSGGGQQGVACAFFQRIAVDGIDPAADGFCTENTIFIVPAVRCAVSRHEVPFRQVNVLADDVGRCGDLIVVHHVEFRHQVRLIVHRTVVRVQTEHKRLWRTGLGKRRRNVFPERDDTLLRVVIAKLVEDHVELDVGCLVDTRIVRAESSRERVGKPVAGSREELAGHACVKHVAFVIHAGLEEGRTWLRQGAVGAV